MNEKEMIEEMAKDTGGCDYPQRDCSKCWRLEERECSAYAYAKTYYEKGYRKIPEGSVVLSKEEYNELKSRAEEVFNEMTERMKAEVKIAGRMGVIKGSKETAKEIFKEIMKTPYYNENAERQGYLIRLEKFNEIAKQFGVEVEV